MGNAGFESNRSIVGLIANPASGKDIRRLVTHATVFDNNEKINIIRRVLLGLDALGIQQVLAMPDNFGMVLEAHRKANVSLTVELLEMPLKNGTVDSTNAATRMANAGVGCIVTLGGDGTNRAVAKGCGYVPLVPISTGTNNAFPVMIEGTLAGLAAAAVALRIPGVREAGVRLAPRLDIYREREQIDFALVDVVAYAERFVASGAIWDPQKIQTVVLAHPRPGTIGASAIGGCLPQASVNKKTGMWIELATKESGSEEPASKESASSGQPILAPIAPGVVAELTIHSYRELAVGEGGTISAAPSVLAMDGEREIPIKAGDTIEVRLSQNGPHVVDVTAVLQAASQAGAFTNPLFWRS
ncbi:MAG: NAD(+)/NADH kinase [Chloroflexota bacterium]